MKPRTGPIRVALMTEIPAPFRIPLFNALAARAGVTLHVRFLSERDPARPYPLYADEFRFDWAILPSRQSTATGRWTIFNISTASSLARLAPDVIVVGGWNQVAYWRALLWARRRRIPILCWCESTSRDARAGRFVVEAAKRWFARACSGFLVPGTASATYVRSLGVVNPIVVAPNAVDNERFGRRVAELREQRDSLRDELGLTKSTVFYVGRLASEKGLPTLFEAVAPLDADLILAGSGADEARLRAHAPAGTRFLGWLDRDELIPWYAAVDVFVLPALSDQWGMVLNEALAAGLPIVSTEAPGAAWDLVVDGENGYRVPVEDPLALRTALERLLSDPALRAQARARSLELAGGFTPEGWSAAVENACREALN